MGSPAGSNTLTSAPSLSKILEASNAVSRENELQETCDQLPSSLELLERTHRSRRLPYKTSSLTLSWRLFASAETVSNSSASTQSGPTSLRDK